MRVKDDEFRPAYLFQDTKNLTIDGSTIYPTGDEPQMVIHNVTGADISGVSVDGNAMKEIQAFGKNSGIRGC